MRKKHVFILLLCALILSMSAFALFGCTKDATLLATSDLPGWDKVTERNALRSEWLGSYRTDRPTVVLFHGETQEEKVSGNIPISVYESAVSFDEEINEGTIGWRAHGLKRTTTGEYDLMTNWTDAALYNVLIVHAEKFLKDDTYNCVTKLYSAYKSRFIDGETVVDCDFGVTFADVLTAYVAEECAKVGLSGEELHFVGYGVGANAALAVACRLYQGTEGKKETLYYGIYPSRVTMCDPYLSGEKLTFSPTIQGGENASSAAEIVRKMTTYCMDTTPVVVELIETKEVNGNAVSYAYPTNERSGETYEGIRNTTVSLVLAESYSATEKFTSYKQDKRIAFDWYLYSVIGSDDSYIRGMGDNTLSIGYPHTLKDYLNEIGSGTFNWDANGRRPMVNDRVNTNDGSEEKAGRMGLNFSLSAWTPTAYLRGLTGVRFAQKTPGDKTGKDVHGNDVYSYEEYVLPSFRSENRQVSDGKETIIKGRIYLDANGDGKINDGEKSGMTSRLYVTIEQNGATITENTPIYTDEFGFYTLVIKDKTAGESVTFTATEGGGRVTGFSAAAGKLTIRLELYCPKTFTAKTNAAKGLWYERTKMNHFDKTSKTADVTANNAHTVLVYNALLIKGE